MQLELVRAANARERASWLSCAAESAESAVELEAVSYYKLANESAKPQIP